MTGSYFEDAAFRLPPQAIIISVAPYETRAAGLGESYAELYSRNRTQHSFIKVFDGLYETSVPSIALVSSPFSIAMHSNSDIVRD
jgi:hypothetical protein